MAKTALPVFSLLFMFVGCAPSQEDIANGDDPIAALSSTVESSRYGQKYWAKQRDAESKLWDEAIDVCAAAEAANYPTCKIVREARFYTRPYAVPVDPRTAPGFGDF